MVNTVNRLSSTDDLHIQHFACWEIMHTFLWSAAFSQNQHFQNFLSGIASCSLKQFGSRPGWLCVVTRSWSWSKLFVNVICWQKNMSLADKSKEHSFTHSLILQTDAPYRIIKKLFVSRLFRCKLHVDNEYPSTQYSLHMIHQATSIKVFPQPDNKQLFTVFL